MKIVAYCPACSTQVEGDAEAAKTGLVCPDCHTGFVPDKVDEVADLETMPLGKFSLRPAREPVPKPESDRIAGHARRLSTVSMICFACALLAFFIGLLNAFEYVGPNSMEKRGLHAAGFETCAGWLLLGILLQLLTQLLHIRELLARRN